MRSYAFLIAGAFAMAANAQSDASQSGISLPTPTNGDPAATSAAAEINRCLDRCDVTDTNCQARCVAVPSPNEDNIAELLECSENCDQGDGSPEDTQAFGECLAKCRDEHFFTEGQGTPAPTGAPSNNDDEETNSGSNNASTTGSDSPAASGSSNADSSDASSTGSDSPSGTGSAEESEESGDGEDSGASVVASSLSLGFVGLFAAFFL